MRIGVLGTGTVGRTVAAKLAEWRHVLDLGDLSGARAMEMYLPLWLRLFSSLGTPFVNVRVVT